MVLVGLALAGGAAADGPTTAPADYRSALAGSGHLTVAYVVSGGFAGVVRKVVVLSTDGADLDAVRRGVPEGLRDRVDRDHVRTLSPIQAAKVAAALDDAHFTTDRGGPRDHAVADGWNVELSADAGGLTHTAKAYVADADDCGPTRLLHRLADAAGVDLPAR